MTLDQALDALRALAEPGRDVQSRAYHKVDRAYLGVSNPVLNRLTAEWRKALDIKDQIDLADQLWRSNIYEARLAAAKLLTQNRIKDDSAVWSLLLSWSPDFDSWAIADHVCMAGHKRITSNPARLAEIEPWTISPHMWRRRAALVITLPFAKPKTPSGTEVNARETVLGWAASYVDDPEWFIQKAIGWWLRDLSKKQPELVRDFLKTYGPRMKPFARREAAKFL